MRGWLDRRVHQMPGLGRETRLDPSLDLFEVLVSSLRQLRLGPPRGCFDKRGHVERPAQRCRRSVATYVRVYGVCSAWIKLQERRQAISKKITLVVADP